MAGRRGALIVAAVLAGAAGIALVVLGWWVQDWQHISDWTNPTAWWGGLIRGVGYFLIGKVGFKAALALVIVVVGLAGWALRRTRKAHPQTAGPTSAETEDAATS